MSKKDNLKLQPDICIKIDTYEQQKHIIYFCFIFFSIEVYYFFNLLFNHLINIYMKNKKISMDKNKLSI